MEENKTYPINETRPVGRRLFGRNRAAGVFSMLAALAAAGMAVLMPFLCTERNYCDIVAFEGVSAEQGGAARAKYCRDSVYGDLCALGTVYLSNCKDGVYGGGRELYEELYSRLTVFEDNYAVPAGELFGINNAGNRALKIEQSKFNITNIDSDYYYFYLAYGDEVLTNIADLPQRDTPAATAEALAGKYPDWYYLRRGMTIDTKTRYDETGLAKTEVYYTAVDASGSPSLTSEYIDSDKLLFGACSHDNYGRYICCFNSTGDNILFEQQPPSGEEMENCTYQLDLNGKLHVTDYQGDGIVDYVIDSEDYTRLLIAAAGGVIGSDGYWINLVDMPDYKLTPVDMSQLTVFMTPKADIVAAFDSFMKKHRAAYDRLVMVRFAIIAVFGVSVAAAMTALLARRKAKLEADGRPYIYSLLKTDSSALLLLLSAGFFLYVFRMVIYYELSTDNIRVMACQAGGAAAAVIGFMMGAGGLIRQLKLGSGGRHECLAADIWHGTEGFRRRVKESFYNSALMKSVTKLGVLTRHRIRFWTSVIIGAMLLFVLLITDFSNVGQAVALPLLVILAATVLHFLISADRTARDITRLTAQVERMTGADVADMKKSANTLDISSPVYDLGQKLESVSDAAEKAVDERVKSEKLKIELVTNVSHDLKTPLTSIISYIDLLEKSELSDEARDYVSILSRKADKLREIVADVFTLAKAVSGVEVELTELDFAVMARQVAADNEDKVEASGRGLKIDIQPVRAPIMADGSKLYRVIQNLLDNSLKYSMEGSRVYFTLAERGGGFELEVRNVCDKEPDFTADEILERFARGDRSRTDGGSGLGLSIAKSFTEACGGTFEIVLDHDVFIAKVFFARREEPPTEPVPETQETDTETDTETEMDITM